MKKLSSLVSLLIIFTFMIDSSLAQKITKDDYIQYLPLSYPRIISQTAASDSLNLYGNKEDTLSYKDHNKDGIDDNRYKRLKVLCAKFSPILFKNTNYSIPLNFKAVINNEVTPLLYIDTWELALAEKKVIKRESINFAFIDTASCIDTKPTRWNSDDSARNEDCQLLKLLQAFHPDYRKIAQTLPHSDTFKVLYFDMPGEDEKSWKRENQSLISGDLYEKYRKFSKIYAHPFIHEESLLKDENNRYEFVIQYWFFYSFNDGGNNHEGDWEHLNVIVTIKDSADALLSREDIERILQTNGHEVSDSKLVIKRVEYYFHHFVQILDYMHPNAYLSDYKQWEAQIKNLRIEKRLEEEKWELIRKRAFTDSGKINTNPIGYIGGDNKGLDQLLAPPGGKNRDSHGTYPFPGNYKGIGPVGATEKINGGFDYRKALEDSSKFERYKDEQIIIVPDWERVKCLVLKFPEARREWSWLILPIRWGFPAAQSPAAGIVKHADTGNQAPVGPAYNTGWNRVGACAGYDLFDPHTFSADFPLGWQDEFINSWGYLNLTLPTLITIPPLDFILGLPIKYTFRRNSRTFIPEGSIPFRRLGWATGLYLSFENDDFARLLPREENEQISQVMQDDNLIRDTSTLENFNTFSLKNIGLQVNSYIGNNFVSENLIRFSNSKVRYGLRNVENGGQAKFVQGDFEMWEYSGSFRRNLLSGSFQPFVKGGYGYSIYRVKNIKINETPLQAPEPEWFHIPTFPWLPNTWHFGIGFEFLPVISYAPDKSSLPWPLSWLSKPIYRTGYDYGIKLEYGLFLHKLGEDAPENVSVTRHQFSFSLTVSY